MKKTLFASDAPKAIGPYSHAVRTGSLLFASGQIPLDPNTGELISGDIEAQTRQVLENLGAVLRAAGLGYEHVVKTTIFVMDLADFQAINGVYSRYFTADFPARSTIQVAGLPKGSRVEIEAIASFPE